MPISTLSRMSVPLEGQSSGQGLLHPKLKYRYRVIFENFGHNAPATELTKQVITCSRPSLEHEHIEIHVYNSRVNLVGKHSWQPIDMEVRDDSSGAVQKVVGEQLQRQFDHYNQSSPVAGEDYKFSARIQILDGGNGAYEPVSLEEWTLLGCYLQSSNFNQLDYSASDVVTISLNIRFDNAVHTPLDSGVGADVGRASGTMITGVNGMS